MDTVLSEERKMDVLLKTQSNVSSFSIFDINKNAINEIVTSYKGYLNIYEWSNGSFAEKWKSSRYSYLLSSSDRRVKSITINSVSDVYSLRYPVGATVKESFIFYAHPVPKSTDIYELYFREGSYHTQKIASAPFTALLETMICDDKTTVIWGSHVSDGKGNLAAYSWNGVAIAKILPQIGEITGIFAGQLIHTPNVKRNVLVLSGSINNIYYCDGGRVVATKSNKISLPSPNLNLLAKGSILGITKTGSFGELWAIMSPATEDALFYKLYMAQFQGDGFSPFKKVDIKGVNTEMITSIDLVDLDGDGIDELVGSELADTTVVLKDSEGPELNNMSSNIFAAKWDGSKYVLKWRRWAANVMLKKIIVKDVTGDNQQEIIAQGYIQKGKKDILYVFKMPLLSQ